ncbi:MAG: 3D domain-containing protein [Parcubacteria group bacterium]|nr:3D domain-containing protein [Parcubacteria group bacterium]
MITKKSLISGFLAVGFAVMPFSAQAGFLDFLDPLGINKIFAKAKNDSESVLGEGQDYFGFSLIQNDSVLATRPVLTPKTYKPKRFYTVSATAYSSTPEQTDHTPFITASGIHVRDGVAAANFLPFGTVFKIPEIFGDKIFVVEDRMNRRYWLNIDIWFPEKELAKEFGIKVVTIEIVS